MSDARLSMKPEKRAKFDAMAREMVQGSIIEDAVTRFVSQVIAECAAAQAAEIERLRAEAARLREALEPLVKYADHYDPVENDDEERCWVLEFSPTLGELRRARAALGGKP